MARFEKWDLSDDAKAIVASNLVVAALLIERAGQTAVAAEKIAAEQWRTVANHFDSGVIYHEPPPSR